MTDYSANLDRTVLQGYMDLPSDGKVQCMYIWIDGSGENVRCKTRTVDKEPETCEGQCLTQCFILSKLDYFSGFCTVRQLP